MRLLSKAGLVYKGVTKSKQSVGLEEMIGWGSARQATEAGQEREGLKMGRQAENKPWKVIHNTEDNLATGKSPTMV